MFSQLWTARRTAASQGNQSATSQTSDQVANQNAVVGNNPGFLNGGFTVENQITTSCGLHRVVCPLLWVTDGEAVMQKELQAPS